MQASTSPSKLPPADTALYNHPLPLIEVWLVDQGCVKDPESPHMWHIDRDDWCATIELDIEQITVRYLNADANGQDIVRAFKYSLSRQDIEAAVFSGP
jgi:hypothetical protein